MNKQVKKKLELHVQTAIEGVLGKQDSRAAAKSKKSVRQASKAVVKKFNKALKSFEEEKEAAKKKKTKTKKRKPTSKTPIKNITGETARIKRSYEKQPATLPVETPVTASAENPPTENL